METVIIVFALIALLCIAFEEVIHLNKAKSTLFLGCLSWCLLFVHATTQGKTEHMKHMLDENLLDIASLWLFLMATMTFVAYLNARGLVGDIVSRILPGELSFRQLMLLLALFSVVLSMLCDNITATLVSLGVVQAFKLDIKERIKLCVLVVFSVNSGGVVLITGDVTTLMIFSEGHVTIRELLGLLIPTLIGVGAGALVKLQHQGQYLTASIDALSELTDNLKVQGNGDNRKFTLAITGVFVGTLELQRSVGNEFNWVTYQTHTSTTSTTYDDDLDNQTIYYRVIATAWTSGTATVALTHANGMTEGIVRIHSVEADNSATVDPESVNVPKSA